MVGHRLVMPGGARLVLLALALLVLGAVTAGHVAYPGLVTGALWPAALGSGLILAAPERRLAGPILVVLVIALATLPLSDASILGWVLQAVALTFEALVGALLFGRGRQAPRLYGERDFAWLLVSAVVAAVVGGLLRGLGAVIADQAVGLPGLLAYVCPQLIGMLIFLPFFAQPVPDDHRYRRRMRVLLFVGTLAVAGVVFLPSSTSAAVFLVMPLLAGSALWVPLRQLLVQLLGVTAITILNVGPFDDLPTPHLSLGVVVDPALTLTAYLFACVCASLPLALAIQGQRARMAEARLERGRAEAIVRSAARTVIIGTDARGTVTAFNPGAEHVLGYRSEEVLGRSYETFHTAVEVALITDAATAELARAGSSWLPQRLERQFTCADGSRRTLSVRVMPIRDQGGRVEGYVAIGDDVTDAVAASAALESAMSAQQNALDQLVRLDREKDRFVSTVSHELRTPVTSILGYLELLLDGMYGEVTGPQREALDRISRNGDRLLLLVDDLLTLSRMEGVARGAPLARVEVDLREVVASGRRVLASSMDSRELDVRLDLPEDPAAVVGDPDLLERLVVNLLSNAVKFTPDGGSIHVRVFRVEGEHVLEVRDSGIGIPIDEQPRLFERFFRSTLSEDAAIQGSGLGLAIANSVAEAHGGSIGAQSAPGRGSTFRVHLPVAVPTVSAAPGSVPRAEVERA